MTLSNYAIFSTSQVISHDRAMVLIPGVIYLQSGPSLERVLRVPGTRDILSSYVVAPMNFLEISG